MKIQYKISSEDVAAFNLQHLKALPQTKKQLLKRRILLSAIYGLLAIALFIYEPGYWPFAWLLMFFAILWFIFYPSAWEYRVRKKILKAFKDKQYEISEIDFSKDGIWVKNDQREGFLNWADLKKVMMTNEHIFMYLTEDDGIIISRAGLKKDVYWEKLCMFIKECVITKSPITNY